MSASTHGVEAPAFLVRSGDGAVFPCTGDETLLFAARRAGLDFPYECASGSCGSCVCRVERGSVGYLWPDAPGLSARDRARGDRVLACQATPSSDITLKSRAAPAEDGGACARMRVEVAVRERLTEDVIRLVLAGPSGVVFRPGQFVIFRLPAPIGRRAYSMANLSNADGRLEFLIKRKVDGAASRFLFEVQPGQSVEIEGPYGRAYLREVSGAGIVGLAGGSGLAPILSIVRAAAQDGSGTPIDVYFGVNAAEQLFCLEELTALQDAGRNLRVHIALRAGASGTAFAAGDALDLMLAQEGDLLAKDLYMGGPAPMIDAAMTRVVRAGLVRADRVFFDRFV